MQYETKLRKIDMNTPADAEASRLLRVIGETALRLAEGQRIDERWLQQQFSSSAMSGDATTSNSGSNLLTVPEACGRLRISRWSLYRLIHEQRLRTVTIGRRRFVARDELERFVVSLAEAGASA
jgi:excisionase family DNA binding protein